MKWHQLTPSQKRVLRAAHSQRFRCEDDFWVSGAVATTAPCIKALCRKHLLRIDGRFAVITAAGRALIDDVVAYEASHWDAEAIQQLREQFATTTNEALAQLLGRTAISIHQKASELGLRKSRDYIAGRLRVPRPSTHGIPTHNAAELGAVRASAAHAGLLRRKVAQGRWVPLHQLVWIAAHGEIPVGHTVIFRPGMRTTVAEEISIERLECVSRAELARRMRERYPKELRDVIHARGVLNRMIRKRRGQVAL